MKVQLQHLLLEAALEEQERLDEAGIKDVILGALLSLSFINQAQANKIADTLKVKVKGSELSSLAKDIKSADSKEDLNKIVSNYSEAVPLVTKIERKDIAPPTGYTPVSQKQRKDWNIFLNYLENKGLAGDASLDRYVANTNKTLGIVELENYLKDNSQSTISPDIVKNIQYEMKILREGIDGFPGLTAPQLLVLQELLLRTRPKFMGLKTSDKDGKIGQWTSKEYYPEFSGSVDYAQKMNSIASSLISKYKIDKINDVDLNKL